MTLHLIFALLCIIAICVALVFTVISAVNAKGEYESITVISWIVVVAFLYGGLITGGCASSDLHYREHNAPEVMDYHNGNADYYIDIHVANGDTLSKTLELRWIGTNKLYERDINNVDSTYYGKKYKGND